MANLILKRQKYSINMQLNKDKQWNNLNAYIKTKATPFKNSLPLKN